MKCEKDWDCYSWWCHENKCKRKRKKEVGMKCKINSDCKSKWCFKNFWGPSNCKQRYGYLQPSFGLCGSNKECADGLFCDGGKCAFNFSTREVNQSCNRNEQCKQHGTILGEGTACCARKCTLKIKNEGNYSCPVKRSIYNCLECETECSAMHCQKNAGWCMEHLGIEYSNKCNKLK